jgi:hypothetical protein
MKRATRRAPGAKSTRRRVVRDALSVAACAIVAMQLAACASPNKPTAPEASSNNREHVHVAPLPDIDETVARYNQRVSDLSRVRTPVTLLLDVPDENAEKAAKGERTREQLEGNLQLHQPDRLSLRVDKVGQTLFVLGANESNYWWLSTGSDATAFVGATRLATPQKAKLFGLPIHPFDLLELLAISPLPANDPRVTLAWKDTSLLIAAPARWGTRELLLDASTLEPQFVLLRDARGVPAVWAQLSKFIAVDVHGNAFSTARMPSRIKAEVPGVSASQNAFVELIIIKPENPQDKMRTKQFELQTVLDSYGVKSRIDIDAPTSPRTQPPAASDAAGGSQP